MQKRLFIVSNRLPVTIVQKENCYSFRQSSGGLISAISAYLKGAGAGTYTETIWAGMPGCNEQIWRGATSNRSKEADYSFLPVFMEQKDYELYYDGFSNSLLWPLFHYFPSFADYDDSFHQAYIHANELFAEVMAKEIKKDDVIWIHDYHLLPLAGMLRKRLPAITIGFFLHIPFPSFELFRVIPKRWQQDILGGMLGADLIGFHTVDYADHFLSCAKQVLNVEHEGQYMNWDNRQVKIDAFPISIDFDLFHNAWDNPGVSAARDKYLTLKGDKKLLFSVDRLDYTKGISNRLKGYEQFLINNPGYNGKVIFALVIVPSRDSITRYAERKKMIDEYIGNLNSRLGSISWQPVIYQYDHLSFEELAALYTSCDLALITPLRDGMNLVSKEFVASRKDKKGVLVLSEMAGAAKELSEALLINPNDTSEIASMIRIGLEMEESEQQERMASMQQRISTYNVNAWAADFFNQLNVVKSAQLEFEIKFLDHLTKAELLDRYAKAGRRLILLDYDGSLVPFSKYPAAAAPGPDVLQILKQLSVNDKNHVYIISGRDSNTLEKWFDDLPIGLIAEHGAKIRNENGSWRTDITGKTDNWMSVIEDKMRSYVTRCPHTFIEKKEFSIAWHYRNADLAHSTMRAKELFSELQNYSPMNVNILNGNKVIEARIKNVNKGLAVSEILHNGNFDFILALGDDQTDEDMFKQLARIQEAYTIKVGNEASFAKYNLYTPYMVQSLLQTIAAYSQKKQPA